MQDRYAGDVGDYVKLALLRAISPGQTLGIAWYLYPDEHHNQDGRHVGYLDQPDKWRHLDRELFDALRATVRLNRTVAALQATNTLGEAEFSAEVINTAQLPAAQRSDARRGWFDRTIKRLEGCDLVFADPDNGLIDDDPKRRRSLKFGKQMPLSEAIELASGRQAVIYHHNTRYPGGHDLEVSHWLRQFGKSAIAVRANAYNCRTFFILNPSKSVRQRTEEFCERWSKHRVRLTEN